MSSARRATYRVQLRAEFGFDQAGAVIDYLAALGISHLYTSPYFQAAPGSTHGYDVVDHSRVSADLGGPDAHARMLAALQRAGMGHLVDTVPNHMAIAGRANRWWWDVLENGLASPHARYFDVDWEPPEARLRNTVLLPVLADHYGRILDRGGLRLHRQGEQFTIRYEDHEFPVDPRSLGRPLRRAVEQVGAGGSGERLAFIADTLQMLPHATDTEAEAVERRHRDQRVAGEMLAELLRADERVGAALDTIVAEYNGDHELLHELLDQQNYRLAWWQAADRDLGYRRFFDVNTLIGLVVDNPQVFHDTHRLAIDLVRRGAADGLRIDHPDGLRDPETYLQRLTTACPGTYVVVEKILGPEERLPATWPVAGTTGYDFLNLVLGLFIDPAAEAPLTAFYADFAGETTRYEDLVYEKKLLVLREVLGSDVNRLTELGLRICERHRRHRDYTRHLLTDGLRAVLACFPVYRTYVRPAADQVTAADRAVISAAVTEAARRRPDLDAELFAFLRGLLTLEVRGELEDLFVKRFQQLSAAAMAKGVEDTTFYCYNRFVALNEVGGDPARFGIAPAAFHDWMQETHERHPQTMLATATHDTKRGEDVRARLAVITECPGQWIDAVRRLSAIAERHRDREHGWPDRNTEYLFYQAVVGAWPLEAERALAYMEKATREAKIHTSWTAPQPAYEAALRAFISGALQDPEFAQAVERFVGTILRPGRVVSLAQTLVKLTAPGVPDVYQGTELWSLSLVDPDNRRPVDYQARRKLLEAARQAGPEEALARMDDGLPKLWLLQRALAVRAERPAAFAPGPEGAYTPLATRGNGEAAQHVVAFARGGAVATVVPRLARALEEWGETAVDLPPGSWRNALTGDACDRKARVGDLFARFPVALLVRQ